MIRAILPVEPPLIAGQAAVLETFRVAGEEYRLYRVPDLDRLLDEIDPVQFERDERMPYWAEMWPSGLMLASLMAGWEDLRGMRLLELGCGLGLPSIVAARMGAHVTATDYSSDALDLLKINATVNGVSLKTRLLDWRSPGDIGRYDLVVAADVLYESWQSERLAEVIRRTVLPTGRALIVDPERLTAEGFASAAIFRGFKVRRRPLPAHDAKMSMVVYELGYV